MKRLARNVVGIVGVGALVAACGSTSHSSSSATTAAGTSATSTAGTSAPASGSAYDAGTYQAELTKLEVRPTSIGETTHVSGKVPPGKTIIYVACPSPSCNLPEIFISAAAASVGWKAKEISAGLTAQSTQAAFDQAIADKPAGIIGAGFPRSIMESQVAQMKADGIPYVEGTGDDPATNGISFVIYTLTGADVTLGRDEATYVLAANGGKAFNSLSVYTSEYPNLQVEADAYKAAILSACPKCTVDGLNVPGTSIGGDLPTRITSYLSAHPDVKWVADGFGDMVDGLPTALSGAGLTDIKVVTNDIGPPTYGYMKTGQNLVAQASYPLPDTMWHLVDYIIRATMHQSTAPSVDAPVPQWVNVRSNLPSSFGNSFPDVVNYAAEYKALWNVGS